MKVYLINLDKDADRLAVQRMQFGALDVGFERVAALETAEVSGFRWWCAVLRPVVKGESGCAASHCECYRRLAASGEECAAVFEDDAVLSGPAVPAVENAAAFCRDNPRAVVLLGDHRESKDGRICSGKSLPAGRFVGIVPAEWDHCSEGYVIGREAAAKLLEMQSPVRVPADWWGYFRHKGWIDLYRVDPPVCGQQTSRFVSNVGERYVCGGRGFRERAWWRIRRIVGVVLDAVLDGRRGW